MAPREVWRVDPFSFPLFPELFPKVVDAAFGVPELEEVEAWGTPVLRLKEGTVGGSSGGWVEDCEIFVEVVAPFAAGMLVCADGEEEVVRSSGILRVCVLSIGPGSGDELEGAGAGGDLIVKNRRIRNDLRFRSTLLLRVGYLEGSKRIALC